MLKRLVSIKNPKSLAAEAFRTLRTNIQFSTIDEEKEVIVVTSSQPNEGKSTVLANLAITMAQSNKKVLLIDCDLRKPSAHKILEISNSEGLTNIIAQGMRLEECVKTTSVNNLFVITSGPIPPNPAELISSKKMNSLLKELRGIFDIILIDAPPVLAVTDAQILSTLADGVMLVEAYGEVEKNAVVKSKEAIDKVGGKILGVVLNKVSSKDKNYYYYGYTQE